MNDKKIDVVCFGGGDWWYHNRAHIDMQLMRRFACNATVLYVNSVVIQKPKLTAKSQLLKKIVRKLKSILTGLKPSSQGFWVFSPFTLPFHHIRWARRLNRWLLTKQVNTIIGKLKINNPLIWVACPGACDAALKLNCEKLVWQRTDRWEEFPNVDTETIKAYDKKLKAAEKADDRTIDGCDIRRDPAVLFSIGKERKVNAMIEVERIFALVFFLLVQ